MGFLDLSNFKKNEDNYTQKKIEVLRKSQISEMTDRELQESIAKNLRIVTSNSKSINGWVTFIGFMFILSIIGGIYFLSQV